MKPLQGKRALITGASSGFGQAIALSFAAAGAELALVGRDPTRLQATADQIASQGGRAHICVADIADEAQIQSAFGQAHGALGPIEILVNNAGMNVAQRSIVDTTSEQWRQLISVNLTAAFIFTKAVLPEMIARKGGTIINVAS